MENLFGTLAKEDRKTRLLLTDSTFIMRSRDPRWGWLRRQYKELPAGAEPVLFLALAVINAVLTQDRHYFILTTRSVLDLLKKDPNLRMKLRRTPALPKGTGWYRALLYTLDQRVRFCTAHATADGYASVFRLQPDFTAMLESFNPEKLAVQEKELQAFLKRRQDDSAAENSEAVNQELPNSAQTPAPKSDDEPSWTWSD